MAVKFTSPINLNRMELQNARLHLIAGDPATPDEGLVWYDSTAKAVKFFNGTAVQTINVTGGTINADTLDGLDSPYFLARVNHTGTQALTTITGHDKAAHDALNIDADTLDGLDSTAFLQLALGGTMGGALTLSGDPTNALHAATKQYVDAARAGLDVKASVRAATTANIALATGGLLTIDGVILAAGDRVLVKNQTAGAENGIYTAASGAWARADDANTDAEVTSGAFTFVEEGTTHADQGWVLTTNNPITLGTTALSFSQFTGGAAPAHASTHISTGSDPIADAVPGGASGLMSGASQTKLNTLPSGALFAKGNIGDGVATSITFTHNLGTRDVIVQVYTNAIPYDTVYTDVERTDLNTVTLRFGTAPAASAYRCVVSGV